MPKVISHGLKMLVVEVDCERILAESLMIKLPSLGLTYNLDDIVNTLVFQNINVCLGELNLYNQNIMSFN